MILSIDPTNEYALYSKGNVLRDMGNNTGAMEYYDSALAVNPTNEYALYSKENLLERIQE